MKFHFFVSTSTGYKNPKTKNRRKRDQSEKYFVKVILIKNWVLYKKQIRFIHVLPRNIWNSIPLDRREKLKNQTYYVIFWNPK